MKPTTLTREDVMKMFLTDMEQPAIRIAIYRSFRKYATLRDQLISEYSNITKIPEDEFHTAIAMKNYQEMSKHDARP